MSNEYPYSNIVHNAQVEIKFPFEYPVSDIKQNVIEKTPQKIVSEFEYPNGFKFKSTVYSDHVIFESNRPLIEKNGEVTIDMDK